MSKENLFSAMVNYVHIYEKWFFLTKENENFYPVPDEKQAHRAVNIKICIPKVM